MSGGRCVYELHWYTYTLVERDGDVGVGISTHERNSHDCAERLRHTIRMNEETS